ncbi:MAG: metal-dependent hydrolase [Anaerolineae bacterium]|nr:metal-dependent hydrolase [Anaerolineae bacterium]
MPSPIAHAAAGYAIYRLSRSRRPQSKLPKFGPVPGLLLITTGFSLLPDLDSIVGLLSGNFGRFHNNLTHSLIVGFFVSLVFALGMWGKERSGFGFWFAIALFGYEAHVLMDSATVGRGVMAFWPFTSERFASPLIIFYGLHWSEGWFSIRHLWTVLTELAFAALLLAAVHGIAARVTNLRSLTYADRDDAAHPG